MRPTTLVTILATCLLGLMPASRVLAEQSVATFQDVLDYVSEYHNADESDDRLFFYTVLLSITSRAGNTDHLLAVCDALVTNVPRSAVKQFSPDFWHCPESLLVQWLGSVDEYKARDPVRLYGPTAELAGRMDLMPAFVDFSYDVSPEGSVENIKVIDSSHEEWEEPALSALEQWRFTPALYLGEPVWALDQKVRLTFEFD